MSALAYTGARIIDLLFRKPHRRIISASARQCTFPPTNYKVVSQFALNSTSTSCMAVVTKTDRHVTIWPARPAMQHLVPYSGGKKFPHVGKSRNIGSADIEVPFPLSFVGRRTAHFLQIDTIPDLFYAILLTRGNVHTPLSTRRYRVKRDRSIPIDPPRRVSRLG